MLRAQYNQLNSQVVPDKSLLQDTIRLAKQVDQNGKKRTRSFRKPTIVVLSACLCMTLAVPVLAATVEPIHELMYMVSPAIAQLFVPVQKTDEDNGIKMEVVSAYIHENVAEIYITMQDLTSDRIDETTDLFDSYTIERPFDSSAYCQRVGYDESTKTATFLITIEEWGSKNIKGDKITFTVREFLSRKKTYDDIGIPIDLSAVGIAKDTQIASSINGGGGMDFEQFDSLEGNALALVPTAPMSEFTVEGIDLTGIGYIDGKLHIQTTIKDGLEKDNHGFFYLKDSNGNKVDNSYSFNFVNQYESPGRIDYNNYVYDIPQSEIANYTLHGDFVTSSMITKGKWKVTFPLKQPD